MKAQAISSFRYTAYRADQSIDASNEYGRDGKRYQEHHVMQLSNPHPLRGHRFGSIDIEGFVSKENHEYLCTFLESTRGQMMVGNVNIKDGMYSMWYEGHGAVTKDGFEQYEFRLRVHGSQQVSTAIAAIKSLFTF